MKKVSLSNLVSIIPTLILIGLSLISSPAAAQTFVYVAMPDSNTVSVIDTATNNIVASIPVGNNPYGVAITPDGSRAYVTNRLSSDVYVIDTATNTVITTIAVGSFPVGVRIKPDGSLVYVACYRSYLTYVIDTATNAVIDILEYELFPNFSPDGSRGYIPDTHGLTVIETEGYTVIDDLDFGEEMFPGCMVVTPDGNRAYVRGNYYNAGYHYYMYVIDNLETDPEILTRIHMGTFCKQYMLIPGTNLLYARSSSPRIQVVDTENFRKIGSIALDSTSSLYMAVTPDGTRAYVSIQSAKHVAVIDTASGSVIETIPMGVYPARLAIALTNRPPVALCRDIEISADESCQARIIPEDVDGGSYDPDEGDTIILSVDNSGPFPLGENSVTLTVTDEYGESDSCTALVTVVDNAPPVPDLAELPAVAGECFAEITSFPTATDNCAGVIEGETFDPLVYGGQGNYLVTWTYDDGNDNTATQTQIVTIQDMTPPVISVTVSPNILWPPNHKMVLITPTIAVSDNCDAGHDVSLTSITMNEGEETNTYDPVYDTWAGDGHTLDDIQVDENGNIYLRAERRGGGAGRVYQIIYTATDDAGNTATASATVTVPHNQ